MGAAYREPDRAQGEKLMQQLIDSVSHGVPAALGTLGQTLKKRAADVLAYFNHPGTSNGPTEAINGRLEHLRGSAPGFRNTSPDPYSRPAGSGRNYTLDHEEPIFLLLEDVARGLSPLAHLLAHQNLVASANVRIAENNVEDELVWPFRPRSSHPTYDAVSSAAPASGRTASRA